MPLHHLMFYLCASCIILALPPPRRCTAYCCIFALPLPCPRTAYCCTLIQPPHCPYPRTAPTPSSHCRSIFPIAVYCVCACNVLLYCPRTVSALPLLHKIIVCVRAGYNNRHPGLLLCASLVHAGLLGWWRCCLSAWCTRAAPPPWLAWTCSQTYCPSWHTR